MAELVRSLISPWSLLGMILQDSYRQCICGLHGLCGVDSDRRMKEQNILRNKTCILDTF